jgi:hypothetical protein
MAAAKVGFGSAAEGPGWTACAQLLLSLLIACATGGAVLFVLLSRHRAGDPAPACPPPSASARCLRVGGSDRITRRVESVCGRSSPAAWWMPPRPPRSGRRGVAGDLRSGCQRQVWLARYGPIRAASNGCWSARGLVTDAQLELIRHGVKGAGWWTAARRRHSAGGPPRGGLDLMVRRPRAGSSAHETALVPPTRWIGSAQGAVIDAYYRPATSPRSVCVPRPEHRARS